MTRNRSDDGGLRADRGSVASSGVGAQRGATALAFAIGVFILGVGVAVGVPTVQRSVRNSRATGIVENLRGFTRAFQLYARQRESWPPPAHAAGQVPEGMRLGTLWSQPGPTGFRYLWAPEVLQKGVRYRATIVLWRDARSAVQDDRRLLEEIDRQIDDGRLQSGKFRLGYRDQPFWVIEP